jgi:hypothetical protein
MTDADTVRTQELIGLAVVRLLSGDRLTDEDRAQLTELVGMLSVRLHELQFMQNFLAIQAQIDVLKGEVAMLQRQSASVS